MNRSHRAALLTSSLSLAAWTTPAVAQSNDMPAGAGQWIWIQSSTVADGNGPQDVAVVGVGSIPYPSPNYVRSPTFLSQGALVYANGDSTANRMRSSYYQHRAGSGVNFYNSMVDTYTIVGPPGSEGTPVNARLVFHATGTLFVAACCGQYLGFSYFVLEAGTWDGNTGPSFHEGFRVAAFDEPNFTRRTSIPNAFYGTSQPTLQVDTAIDGTLTRTVGQPFDVAYCLDLTGHGAGDLGGTPEPQHYIDCVIDWELPAGYSITSTLGWTDPNGPPPCPADVNNSGHPSPLSVQDIFDFLAFYFAADPRGDFNGVSGHTVQDIFDFLAAYFAGCP